MSGGTGPKKKRKEDAGLAEVERALAALAGRDPEAMRAEREFRTVVEKKRAQTRAIEAESWRRRHVLGAAIGLGVGLLIAITWSVVARQKRWAALEAELSEATTRWTQRGFSIVSTQRAVLEATIDEGCYVALARGPLEVVGHGEPLDGEGSVAWCTCARELVKVQAKGDPNSLGGVRLLTIAASEIGGWDGFALFPEQPGALAAPSEVCRGEHFDAWMSKQRGRASPKSDEWMEVPGRANLRKAGFTTVARGDPTVPFTLVELEKGSCAFAVSTEPKDLLSLRLPGNQRAIEDSGPFAWCTATAISVSIWRTGTGSVRVVAAPARRVGGILGTVEQASRAGLTIQSSWVRTEDLAWDATQSLLASGVPDARATPASPSGEIVPIPDARLLAFSMLPGGAFAPMDGVQHSCVPDFAPDVAQSICAQLSPIRWRQTPGTPTGAAAQGTLPIWLTVLASVRDPRLNESLIHLLSLARRLAAMGFEPTAFNGITELAGGVEVIGRAGDDAVVAVGLGPVAPYVFPYGDGVAWTIQGEPRIVELAPGERTILTAAAQPTLPARDRRTVVFRHPKPQG